MKYEEAKKSTKYEVRRNEVRSTKYEETKSSELQTSDFRLSEKGFAALFITLLVLLVMSGIAISLAVITLGQERVSGNITKSTQSYYLAEAGVEDALLKLSKAKPFSTPYSFSSAAGSTTVEISDQIGGARTITSAGNVSSRIRKIQVVYQISSDAISFYYGAQVGDGGMEMGNNSEIQGNVFSNGNVTGGGAIDNDIIVAGNGNKIQGGLHVKGNATVHSCENATVDGNLIYVSGGSVQNCTVGGAISTRPNQVDSEPLPIPQSQIDDWKSKAAAGGINTNNVIISGTQSMGPVQIGTPSQPKNLTISNNSTLQVTGTIYVTGNITTGNGSKIQLDTSYGSLSGTVMADGVITVGNNAILTGSGQVGSYILILSTKSGSGAIVVGNNALGAVFYTSAGGITLSNNMTAREVTGYQITLSNNAVIQYESGLGSLMFSSGPGGGWEVASWKEVE